jgi:hypothetical protein
VINDGDALNRLLAILSGQKIAMDPLDLCTILTRRDQRLNPAKVTRRPCKAANSAKAASQQTLNDPRCDKTCGSGYKDSIILVDDVPVACRCIFQVALLHMFQLAIH